MQLELESCMCPRPPRQPPNLQPDSAAYRREQREEQTVVHSLRSPCICTPRDGQQHNLQQ